MSLLILAGVLLMQLEHAGELSARDIALGIVPILVATFAYPLGNRKMMELCNGRLDVSQRVNWIYFYMNAQKFRCAVGNLDMQE